MQTRHCKDCVHWNTVVNYDEWPCDKEHRPRFYNPRSLHDMTFGFKRKCEDFKIKVPNADVTGLPERSVGKSELT